ncbi:FadR/GntR family transcriptional regulator [Yinghuangia soli]|uniref:FCD domain-containing protein n=1 Tax=Yinghuangia soli TaxID=2908204 RepID=A0AA41Q6G7_9ACTN|nr:FCD domain-containing protein [Yinghuangia soli]MCF2532459.1 FCD domain-containing protein [Yinghuangia soli]
MDVAAPRSPRFGGPVRGVSVAEELADVLRDRVLDGGMRDGDLLPKQSDLQEEYQVGTTTLRQAIRILETEGLVTVRRGNTGGLAVRLPSETDAARTFGLVLRSRRVPLDDLAAAVRNLEPTCAGLCAAREDRDTEVVPRLRELHERCVGLVDDLPAFVRACRDFHEGLVQLCGNTTMQLLLGTAETLWSAHERHWVDEVPEGSDFTERIAGGLEVHHDLIELIAAGDVDGAHGLARRHVEFAQSHPLQERPGVAVQSLPES